MIVADRKRDQILEKAMMRFAHFGIQKTTMNEIADDLAMSKPSVYYYFPDKTSLVVAVIERIFSDYQQRLSDLLATSVSIEHTITNLLELRIEFAKKYFMLHIDHHVSEISITHPDIKKVLRKMRETEVSLLAVFFEKAIGKSTLKINDPVHTAEIFLDMMTGASICILARQEKQLVPDSAGFDDVLKRQKELTSIFLKGLTG
jgi:AcrR family transcriptional regulator